MALNIRQVPSPNHYNGRNGYRVTHITLHIMVGRLAGTDAVFQRPSSQASAHYGIGGTGEIHQYVSEANGSYSDANFSSNNSTISIEHEGGMAGVPMTDACVEASAQLCADISRRYGLGKLWHDGLNGNVWLHREIPGTDHYGCPDRAPNGLPVQRVIDRANQLLTNPSSQGETEMSTALVIWDDDSGVGYYWSPETGRVGLSHPDQVVVLKNAGVKEIHSSKKAPWAARADQISQFVQAKTTAYEKAQTAALEAMAKSIGADPNTIADTVRKAVESKLATLDIQITTKDKGTGK